MKIKDDKLSKFKFYGIYLPADINGKIQVNGKLQVKIPIPSNAKNPKVYLITPDKKKGIKKKKIKGSISQNKSRYIIEIKESGLYAIGDRADIKKENNKPSHYFDYTDKDTNIQIHANRGILNDNKSINTVELSYEDCMALATQDEALKLLNYIKDKHDDSIEIIKKETGESKDIQAENQRFTDMLQFIEDSCKSSYESELERGNSIQQQASNMQAAFSFITAGMFVIAQIVCEQIDKESSLSTTQVFIGFGSITAWLIISLFLATLAQSRKIRKDAAPSPFQLIQNVFFNYSAASDTNERQSSTIIMYHKMYEDLHKINDKRVKNVKYSMMSFLAAIAESIVMAILMALQAGLFCD